MKLKEKLITTFNDPEFKFIEESHSYYYKGVPYISITTFIERFHELFDRDLRSREYAIKHGLSQEEVLEKWDKINKRANVIGSATHLWIENYYNKIIQEIPTDVEIVQRINKYNIIYAEKLHNFINEVSELRVFSKKFPLAGTIDNLSTYKNELYIVDYKTNKEFTTDKDSINSKWKKYLYYPFDKYYDNKHNFYSLQLSLYAMILEEWGFKVKNCYLIYIGPGDEPAKIYKARDFKEMFKEYLETYKF